MTEESKRLEITQMIILGAPIAVCAGFFLNPFSNHLALEVIATVHLGVIALMLAICATGYSFAQTFDDSGTQKKVRRHISGLLSSFFYLTNTIAYVWIAFGATRLLKIKYQFFNNLAKDNELHLIIEGFSSLMIFGVFFGFVVFMYQFWITVTNDEQFLYDKPLQ